MADIATTEEPSRVTAAQAGLLERLAARLGPRHVLTAPGDLEPYLLESRHIWRGTALAAVRPADTAEVAFAVGACAQAGVPVVPQGGNTGLVGGGVPHGGIVLSLARLDRIREVDAANATLVAEAGVTLARVQEAAAAAGMLFPLSLASEGSCRIGGNLASNAGGTGVLRYGNARELALGLEVVLADGRVWNGLKGLRKDNMGFDLRDLFIGSEGTLGIITAAVLKLFPRPRAKATAFVGCPSPQAALALFAELRAAAGDKLSAFEYLNAFSMQVVLRHVPGAVRPLAADCPANLLLELTSPDPEADLGGVFERVLGEAIEAGTVEDATIAASETQGAALWRLREMLSEVQGYEGASIKHDVSVPVSRVADFIDAATAACEAEMPGIRVCAFGHVGDGNIHFNLSQPVGMDRGAYLAEWERFNRIVHDIADAFGGSIAAEHGIGLLKREELERYKDPVGLDLMRTLKRALDPANILNPGKVVAIGADLPPPLPVSRVP